MDEFRSLDTDTADLTVIDPSTGAVIRRIAVAGAPEVDIAVRSAAAAFAGWAGLPPTERATALAASAASLRAHAAALSALLSQETGKPRAEADAETAMTADILDYYAGIARARGGRIAPAGEPGVMNLILKEPIGIIGAIVPFNFPLLLWAWKAAPALAAGNCVVVKPPPEAPLALTEACSHIQLPAGVLTLVQGGAAVGDALVKHRMVDKIAFTGSATVGKRILAACAEQAKRSLVEMSGHDAMIVWDDVDLTWAANAAVFGAFINAGQVCTSVERIYVAATVYERFVEKMASAAGKLRAGGPDEPGADFGPMIGAASIGRMREYVAWAISRGGRIVCGGAPLARPGHFFAPTLITGVPHADLIARGEVFGPVTAILPVSSFDEAIAQANDTPYGLSATVLTADLQRAMHAATRLRAGTIWINSALVDNIAAPFGGFRQAGIGRELGEEGFDAFQETKHVALDFSLAEKPWWFSARRRAAS